MKKIALFLVLMTSLLSCTLDEGDKYMYYVLPIDSYTLPETFKVGETHTVTLKYQKPTACYNYDGIYYYAEGNTRTIGIHASVKQGQNCSTELPPLTEVSFNFAPATAGTYLFKFYKGTDDDDADGDGNKDEDVFEEVEITVTE